MRIVMNDPTKSVVEACVYGGEVDEAAQTRIVEAVGQGGEVADWDQSRKEGHSGKVQAEVRVAW